MDAIANNASMEKALLSWGAVEVSAMDVYRDVFRIGEGAIQSSGRGSRDFKGNPLAYWKDDGSDRSSKGHYRILFEDTFEQILPELQEADFCILNGLSYYGRRNTLEAADKMFALIIDLDDVTGKTLNNFLFGAIQSGHFDVYPIPNYVVLSGHGVHLYYVFEEPVSLFPNVKVELKRLKYALIQKIWIKPITARKPQYQGINQGFRVIGGKTKVDGVRVRAFRVNTHPVTVGYLNKFVSKEDQVDERRIREKGKLTREQAKKRYPAWYKAVVENGETWSGGWTCKRDLYEWWKRKIREPVTGATFGHRYHCIMCLVIYGVKCGLELDEIRQDALSLIPYMNAIYPDQSFTEQDVVDALEVYDRRCVKFTIGSIERWSGIRIDRNKRNGRKQALHLKIARQTLEVMNEDSGSSMQGRPEVGDLVTGWRREHPYGRKADCVRDTGLSKPTVYKYWDQVVL